MLRKLIALSVVITWSLSFPGMAAELVLEKGDHICLVGNALGERMQHHNYWETLLQQRFPQHELVVRNLCFPGDEPFERIRSLNFGEPDAHLTHSKASVVLFSFGFNESFADEDGLDAFTADMTRLVNETKQKNYSGQGAPRIVLLSPIAFENTGDHNLPNGTEHNRRLADYSEALALYHGLWTFALWTLFGSYVLAFWILGAVGQSVARLIPAPREAGR